MDEPWVLQARLSSRSTREGTGGVVSAGEGTLLVSVRGDDERQVADRLNEVIEAAISRDPRRLSGASRWA